MGMQSFMHRHAFWDCGVCEKEDRTFKFRGLRFYGELAF